MRQIEDIITKYDSIIAEARTRQTGPGYWLHHVDEMYYSYTECVERKLNDVVPVTASEHLLLHKLILLAKKRSNPASAWYSWYQTLRLAVREKADIVAGTLSEEDKNALPPGSNIDVQRISRHESVYNIGTAQYGPLRPVKDYILNKSDKQRIGKLANKSKISFPCYRQDSDLLGYSVRRAYPVNVVEDVIRQITGNEPNLARYAPLESRFMPVEAEELLKCLD